MGECVFTGRGGKPKKLPILNSNYPADVAMTFIAGSTATATFEVRIVEDGNPASYTYQWYVDGNAVEGANASSYVWKSTEGGAHEVYCVVTNRKGTVKTRTASLSVEKYFLPTLNSVNPADAAIEYKGSHTFSVGISTHGNPSSYTYQWYKGSSAISGATSASYTASGLAASATFYCKVTNKAGTVQSRTATLTVGTALPTYTYSGSHELINDGSGNWRIKLKSSGNLKFTNRGTGYSGMDIFAVGGGGGGGTGDYNYGGGGGGGGGYCKTVKGKSVANNTTYWVDIGAGGGTNTDGGASAISALSISASGGKHGRTELTGYGMKGGAGGSGGGGAGYSDGTAGAGGYNGASGSSNSTGQNAGGVGSGSTTGEFGSSSATIYSSGGGGGAGMTAAHSNYTPGTPAAGGDSNAGSGSRLSTGGSGKANFGGGGGGGGAKQGGIGGTGGSGIIVIRNKR